MKNYKLHFKKQINKDPEDKWLTFCPEFGKLCFRISPSTYFDDRPELNIYLTTLIALIGFTISCFGILPAWTLIIWTALFLCPWGQVFLHFPLYTGIEECEHPQYGFYFFSENNQFFNCFVWCWGMKTKHYDMPWHWDWVRTSVLRKDGTYEHDVKGDRKDFYQDQWKGVLWSESYPYKYILNSGKIQERVATVKVEEREWRWTWFKSVSPRKINKTINVKFNDEVGERTGTWKGGTVGCGYSMLPGETPEQTLRRMESVRKF